MDGRDHSLRPPAKAEPRRAGPRRLEWWRRAARVVLWAEFLARAAWPAAAIVAGTAGVALLGLIPAGILAPSLFLLVALAALGASGAASWQRERRPSPSDAERRLERDSGLAHRPFMVLRDRPAAIAGAAGLWHLHAARAEAALKRLRLSAPAPGLPARDPYALRFLAVLVLAAGVIAAGDDALPRLRQSFLPSFGVPGGVPVTVQAWVEPPAYTGLPPIFLPRQGGAIQVPTGAKLTISVTGGSFRPRLSGAAASGKFRVLSGGSGGGGSWQATAVLRQTGPLRITPPVRPARAMGCGRAGQRSADGELVRPARTGRQVAGTGAALACLAALGGGRPARHHGARRPSRPAADRPAHSAARHAPRMRPASCARTCLPTRSQA